jgi:hypothetical protein
MKYFDITINTISNTLASALNVADKTKEFKVLGITTHGPAITAHCELIAERKPEVDPKVPVLLQSFDPETTIKAPKKTAKKVL